MLKIILKELRPIILRTIGLAIICTIFISIIPNFGDSNFIPSNILYIQESSDKLDDVIDNLTNVTFCKTKKMSTPKISVSESYTENSTDTEIYYLNLIYQSNTTQTTITRNSDKVKNNTLTDPVSILYNFNCDLRGQIRYDEGAGKFNNLILGGFPEENEILLSENYALQLIADENSLFNTYNDLIDSEIEIANKKYVVSGIYSGSNNLYVSVPNETIYEEEVTKNPELDEARIIEFADEKEKQNFIDTNLTGIEYLDSSKVNKLDFNKLITVGLTLTSSILLWLYSYQECKRVCDILNYHYYSKYNFVQSYISIIGIIAIFIFVNIFVS